MSKRAFLLFITLLIVMIFPFNASAEPDGWYPVGEGIDYREYYLADPNIVYVARLDRLNPKVTIDTSIALGKLSTGLETVSSQARRYDEALNYWGAATIPHESGGWGARNQVVVAINGTFTLPPGYQQPWQGQIHSGWYSWRFQDTATRNAFTWKMDRTPFIGDCVRHPSGKQVVTYATLNTQEIDGINVPRDDDELVLYTSQFDRDTQTNNSGLEVLVEMDNPTQVVRLPGVTGIVRDIRKWGGSTLIPFDHVVLSAEGAAFNRLDNNVQIGDQIEISQFIRNCDSGSTLDWSRTYASLVSNDFYFLKDGVYQYNDDNGANVRNPRTAVAFNERYVYFIVVDGRYAGRSIGMTMQHLANFAKSELDALHGLSLDGGGSSTIVVNDEVMNFPSDGIPQPDAQTSDGLQDKRLERQLNESWTLLNDLDSSKIFLPLLQKQFLYTGSKPPPPPYPIVERGVPNGLMMVAVQPKDQSTTFTPGDEVIVQAGGSANLRLGPGTNYQTIQALPDGTQGVVLDHMNGLNGVAAKGFNWWKVSFGGVEGWIAEGLLVDQ